MAMNDSRKARSLTDLTNPFQRFRSMRGLSQLELATLIGVAQPTLSMYESGKRRPQPQVAQRFLEACRGKMRCSLEEIYGRT